jgi:hypothetical protein
MMRDLNKQFSRFFVLTVIIAAVSIILSNFAVDPLRFYRDSTFPEYSSEERFQNPGLARNKPYNALILGTSMSQNFIPDKFDQLFGKNSLLLTISAGTSYEQRLTLELALEKGKPELVLWELHPKAYLAVDGVLAKESDFPTYMYDADWLNDIFYLFNFSNSAKALVDLKAYLFEEKPDHRDSWKKLNYWGDEARYGCPHLLREQIKKRGLPNLAQDRTVPRQDIVRAIETNLVNVIDAHADTQFVLFIPPFSSLEYALAYRYTPELFKAQVFVREYVFSQLARRSNVLVYDFATNTEVTGNLGHYKDLTHYSPAINEWMLTVMKDKMQAMTTAEAMPAARRLLSLAQDYDADGVIAACESAQQ